MFLVSTIVNLVTTTNLTPQELTFSSAGNIDTMLLMYGLSTNHILVLILYIIYILHIINQIRETISNLVYHNKHYTDKWNQIFYLLYIIHLPMLHLVLQIPMEDLGINNLFARYPRWLIHYIHTWTHVWMMKIYY